MGDKRRTRDDRNLAHLLALQLNGLRDDWAPEDRHSDRMSHTDRVQDQLDPLDPMALAMTGRHVWVDDMDALIARSFDYEAVEWLTYFVAAPASRATH